MVFLHIPLPEFGDDNLVIRSGHRREPTKGTSLNTHFYDVLAGEGVAVVGSCHDHVNDFCALLPGKMMKRPMVLGFVMGEVVDSEATVRMGRSDIIAGRGFTM
jgi:hypothetical protein